LNKKEKLMDEKEKACVITEQYKSYIDAKEKFIDRNFATNRFYTVLSLSLLAITYLLIMFFSSNGAILTVTLVGLTVTLMWWLNIDSYQFLIKVKYSKVIDFIEEMLPIQPYKKEFEVMQDLKKDKKNVVFADMQKFLTLVIFCIFVVIFVRHVFLLFMVMPKGTLG